MSLIFVTGIAGAGKSTVRRELVRRGLPAYDTDEDEIAQWRNRVTGRITPLNAEAHRTPEFLAHNDWIADPERVRRLASDGASRTVFLCGLVGNEEEVRSLFDKVVLLSIDEATMRHRLARRTSHDFGARPHELDLLVAARDVIEQYYRDTSAIIIDASRTPAVVADDILDNVDS